MARLVLRLSVLSFAHVWCRIGACSMRAFVEQRVGCVRRCVAGPAVAAILVAASASPLPAAGVSIEGEEPARSLKLHLDNASVEGALTALSEKFGFDYVGPKSPGKTSGLSTTLSGSLHSILSRLLRNRNHSIVRSSRSPGGIRKVVLIDSRIGSNLKPGQRPGYRRAKPAARRSDAATKTAPQKPSSRKQRGR